MRSILATVLVVGVAAGAGCKNKQAGPGGGSATGSGAAGATGGSGGSGGAAPVATAAGGEVKDLPVVTDCPKSLGGAEKVARTIKKACGPIQVTSSLEVDGSLTLEAGVVLKFAADAELSVGYHGPAKLIITGGDAPDQRVVFTSAGDQAAGVWRGVTLHDGADRSQITGLDVLYAGVDDHAAVTLRDAVDVTFTKSTVQHAKDTGLATHGKSTFAQFAGNTFADIGKVAVAVDPTTVGTLAPGNTFDKDAFVQVRGGTVGHDATWRNVGAPYHVLDHVYVDTASTPVTLTIADATLAFAPGIELSIGYHSRGRLRVTGPAVLTGVEATPGSWTGVRVYDEGDAAIDNATVSAAGKDDGGAIHARGKATLTLGTVTLADNKLGLWVDDEAKLSAAKPLTFRGNERAAHVGPTVFGALTGANVYADGQIIDIAAGTVRADVTWAVQAKAAVHVLGELYVDDRHTLTIAAGGSYAWAAGSQLAVGYHSTGTVKVAGKADAPVTLTALDKADPWKGIQLYDEARAADLAYVNLEDVGGDAGVIVRSHATGKLDHVSCARCAATVAPACGAKLELTAITAGAATKVAQVKPTGC